MDETSIISYLTDTFDDVQSSEVAGDYYVFYDPEQKFPFVTLVTGDRHDTVSDLERPGIYRLNIGISKQTFKSMFGDTGEDYDYTTLDHLMPHPVYGKMYWVCILNPSASTFEMTIRPLFQEAYDATVAREQRKQGTGERRSRV